MEPTNEQTYRRVWRAVTEAPWAILPGTLDAIVEVLTLRDVGLRFSLEEAAERVSAAATGTRTGGRQQGAVAVLPLYGTIAHRMGSMAAASGGTSTEAFAQMFRQVMADPQIGAVVIDVDSPGGSVNGVPELAAEIYAARGSKPIVAVANDMAASAAYWIATAADEISVTPSGMVGSIGVRFVHQEESTRLEREGIKTTIISAGKYKADGHPAEPLSDDARAHLQATTDEYYGMFVDAVARGRGVTTAAVRSGYGEGRVLTAKAAKAAGMVDHVETLDAAIARMMKRRPASAGAGPQRAEAPAADGDGDAYTMRRRRLHLYAPPVAP